MNSCNPAAKIFLTVNLASFLILLDKPEVVLAQAPSGSEQCVKRDEGGTPSRWGVRLGPPFADAHLVTRPNGEKFYQVDHPVEWQGTLGDLIHVCGSRAPELYRYYIKSQVAEGAYCKIGPAAGPDDVVIGGEHSGCRFVGDSEVAPQTPISIKITTDDTSARLCAQFTFGAFPKGLGDAEYYNVHVCPHQ